jgi:hypothetical protein
MTAIAVTKVLPSIIDRDRYCRNGQAPSAELATKLTSGLNHAMRYRRKQFASYSGRRVDATFPIFDGNTGAGPVTRWRFRNVTGYGTKALRFLVKLALDNRGMSADSRVRFGVTPSGGAEVFTGYMHYGTNSLGAAGVLDIPSEIGLLATSLEVSEATHYEVRLLTYDEARPVSCLIYEEPEDPDTATNYYTTPGYQTNADILDSHRGDWLPAWTALMKKNASPIWQWSVDDTAITRTSATYRNVHDQTSTAHAASSAGVTISLVGKNTYSRSTVPALFCVYASGTGASGTAKVKLINAGGDLSVINTITTAGWYTATVNLATASQKLDLMIASGGALDTCSLHAMSLYQDE